MPLIWSLVGIALFVGAYTTWGGLGAVVWTDVIQGCFMVVSGVIVTIFGLRAIGGIDVLMAEAGEKIHVALPMDHPEYPFPATFLGGYFLIGIYYWCQNQTIVQRTLGARTEWNARMGTMVACFIKLITPFILCLPGVIAFILFPKLDVPDQALPLLVSKVVPIGLSGLVIAAIMAALMSSADSTVNSWGTLLTYDIYHRLIDKKASSKRLILVGRLATIFLLTFAVWRSPTLRDNPSVLQFLLNGLAYITTPIIVLSLVGVFWRRATQTAAVVTILTAPRQLLSGSEPTSYDRLGTASDLHFYWLPVAVTISVLVMITVSSFTRPKDSAALAGLIWARQDTLAFGRHLFRPRYQASEEGTTTTEERLRSWKDYRLVGALALIILAVLMWVFR